jgi:hypothetical protein
MSLLEALAKGLLSKKLAAELALALASINHSPEEGVPATERLLRPAFGMYRVEWPDTSGIEFHLSHGDWIRLLRRSGFEVEDLIEIRPAAGATSRYPFVTLEWARNWPCEEVWKARKTLSKN